MRREREEREEGEGKEIDDYNRMRSIDGEHFLFLLTPHTFDMPPDRTQGFPDEIITKGVRGHHN